jgi:hypothetical protein
MFKKKEQLTRLGDVLVDKGIISKAQLDIAIQEQSRRKKLLDPSDPTAKVSPIGEILIELGFIDQLQLKRGLNWQQRLRHVSIAMALCAPFMMFVPNIARAAPTTIEAETYTTMSGVIKENTADVGGGQNLGDINTGDWMTYSNINVPATGTYKITYRVSSYNGGAIISLRDAANTSLGSVPIPKTGSWSNWIEVEQTVTLQQGTQSLKIFAEVGGLNLNWFKLEQVTPVVAPPASTFPLTLQAESYTTMSGVIKETSSDVGGGQTLGDINTGDWINYGDINVPEAGAYKIIYRVSSYNGGAVIALKGTGDTALGTVAIPKTGNWSTWVDVEQTVTLPKGVQNLKIFAQVGGLNLNWFRIEPATTATVTPPPVPTPAPISTVIESENYSTMKGVVVETTTDVGGGKSVGGISTGDTMSYANTPVNIPVTGKYKISYRVATPGASSIVVLNDINTGAVIDTLAVPKTGGWQKWVTVEREVTLNKGEYKFSMLAKAGGFNINWFKVETVTGGGSATTSSASSVQSSSSSSAPAVSSSSSSTSSVPAMSSSSTSSWSSSSAAAHVAGPVEISWTAPVKRENGVDLYVDELGGYEIRYKKPTDTKYTYVSINDPWAQSYKFDWLEGDYVFQIAAFDKNGIYSPFEDIQRQ